MSLSPEAARGAEILAPRIVCGAPGEAATDICQWCFNPFEFRFAETGAPRCDDEYEALRRVLLLPQDALPVICDACYGQVILYALPARLLSIPGTSNVAQANALLR